MKPGGTRQLKLRIRTPTDIDPGVYQLALRLVGSELGVPNLTDGTIKSTIPAEVV